MADSVEALVNQALIEIGYPERIGNIYEGSRASVAALEVYQQTRQELFDAGEWPLARRGNIALTLLKGPPPAGGYNPAQPWTTLYPPPGWLYEYQYPDDMLELKAIIPQPAAMFDLDPAPAVWRVDNDNSLVDNEGNATVDKKVILTNTKSAIAVYIADITNIALWEPGFVSVVVKRLAEKLTRVLLRDETVERDVTMAERQKEAAAEPARG